MADYISREAIADTIQRYYENGGYGEYSKPLIYLINAIPAADVVVVVRCRDCIYQDGDPDDPHCYLYGISASNEYYCASGRRKGVMAE